MTHKPGEYQVEGYGVKTPGYDQPYLSTAALDPVELFPYAGDPKKQAQFQKDLIALDEATDPADKPVFLDKHPALQSNASADTNKNSKEDASDYSVPPQPVVIDKGIETETHNADGSPKGQTGSGGDQSVFKEQSNGDSGSNEHSTDSNSGGSGNSSNPSVNLG
jgi:hypothetical protein